MIADMILTLWSTTPAGIAKGPHTNHYAAQKFYEYGSGSTIYYVPANFSVFKNLSQIDRYTKCNVAGIGFSDLLHKKLKVIAVACKMSTFPYLEWQVNCQF